MAKEQLKKTPIFSTPTKQKSPSSSSKHHIPKKKKIESAFTRQEQGLLEEYISRVRMVRVIGLGTEEDRKPKADL